jgi:hypothetical protein
LVLAAVFVVASVAYASYTSMQPKSLPTFTPRSSPPARLLLCEGAMDVGCAQDAAERAFTRVAWMDEPSGYKLAWVWATGDPGGSSLAMQYLLDADGQGAIEVVTAIPAIDVEPGTLPSRFVSNGDDTASVLIDDEMGWVAIDWTHDGTGYLISAKPRPWNPDAIVDAWRTIQYASPSYSFANTWSA